MSIFYTEKNGIIQECSNYKFSEKAIETDRQIGYVNSKPGVLVFLDEHHDSEELERYEKELFAIESKFNNPLTGRLALAKLTLMSAMALGKNEQLESLREKLEEIQAQYINEKARLEEKYNVYE